MRLPVDQNGLRVFDESVNRLYVMANESYELFAKALQDRVRGRLRRDVREDPDTGLCEDCGGGGWAGASCWGGMSPTAVWNALVKTGILAADGKLQPSFDPTRTGFALQLPEAYQQHEAAVIDVLASYQMERHIRRERDERKNVLRKEVVASPEFQELWNRIKPRTTYRVEFDTDELVTLAVGALRKMPKIEEVEVQLHNG